MEFEIGFNRGDNEDGLIALGAAIKQVGKDYGFFIEIKDFAELEAFEKKVEKLFGFKYSLIIGFDHPTIFLDEEA